MLPKKKTHEYPMNHATRLASLWLFGAACMIRRSKMTCRTPCQLGNSRGHKLPAHGVAGANADKLRSGWVFCRGALAALHEAPIRPREMRTRNTIEAGLLAVGEEPAHLQAHASRVAIDAVRLADDQRARISSGSSDAQADVA